MGICESVDSNSIGRIVEFGSRSAAVLSRGGNLALQRGEVPAQYVAQAAAVIPANVIIYSGCSDTQTSADVGDVTSFGLPPVSDAAKAGGACTNGLLAVLKEKPNPTYGEVLLDMRQTLKARGYSQIPQLSSSHQLDMTKEVFSVRQDPSTGGTLRAALVGINYTGHSSGQLNGCVNDVRMMERMLRGKGYGGNNLRILSDDPSYGQGMPTKNNIIQLFKWLVEGAKSGDSLFIHYSGHGTLAGSNAAEKDGRDEAIVPLDYDNNGLITDDMIFQLLVAPLPAGAQLVGVFDCCHSGTIVDLPFIFSATDEGAEALSGGAVSLLGANSQFSFETALQLIAAVAKGLGVFPGAKSTVANEGTDYQTIALSFLRSAAKAAMK